MPFVWSFTLPVPKNACPQKIKNPYILDFLGLPDSDVLHESKIEKAIIDNLQSFLLELGKGFAFVGRQKRIQFDDKYITDGDNPTIGLILCTKKNKTIARYSVLNDSQQLFASKYMLYLPTEEELVQELDRERKLIEAKKDWISELAKYRHEKSRNPQPGMGQRHPGT